MKHLPSYMLCLFLGTFLLTSCVNEEWTEPVTPKDGRVTYKFQGTLLEEQDITTRAIDPDGKTIRTLWLFCFDENGLFLERAKASISPIDGENVTSGTFTADIPATTGIIHYLANVNLDSFEDRNYLGTTESYVISPLISTSGRLTYWSRGTYNYTLSENPEKVILYRSQAMVTAKVDENTATVFSIQGIAVCNKWLSGTVAPFNPDASNGETRFNWTTISPFVTYHGEMQKETDPAEVTEGQMGEYIFEHENTGDDPLYVILKGKSDKGNGTYYYKIQLVDKDKHFYPIYRNYRYTITVKGDPGKGYLSFEAAKTAAPYNNPLFDIDASLPNISSGDKTLQLKLGTTIVINEDNVISGSSSYTYDVPYEYKSYIADQGWEFEEASDIEITQNDGFITSAEILKGETDDEKHIRLTFKGAPNGSLHIGIITIWGGSLSRTLTIYYTKKFMFSSVFVTDKIENKISEGTVATLTFTVPDSYPTALFPLDCKITATDLNPSEETLPVIKDDDGYGYLKRVDGPGVYSVAFKNISISGENQTGDVILSAGNFQKENRIFTYTNTLNSLSLDKETITLAPRKGVTATFAITSQAGETLSVYSRYSQVTSPTNTVTTEDIATGLKKYTFPATGTNTAVTIASEVPLAGEMLNITGTDSRSVTLKVENSPSYDFDLKINGSSTAEVSYLPGTSVTLTFTIPDDAWIAGSEYYLFCENLAVANGNPRGSLVRNTSGFVYKPTSAGKQTVHLKTKAVASAETISLLADATQVSFNKAESTYTNSPVTGQITYARNYVSAGGFVAVERSDGLRVGRLTIKEGGAYTLVFYPDYKIEAADDVFFTYTQGNATYQCRITVEELCTGNPVNLAMLEIK